MDVSWREKCEYEARQLIVVAEACVVYGVKEIGEVEERRSGGRMNVRIVLSALEVRRVVPSAVLWSVN